MELFVHVFFILHTGRRTNHSQKILRVYWRLDYQDPQMPTRRIGKLNVEFVMLNVFPKTMSLEIRVEVELITYVIIPIVVKLFIVFVWEIGYGPSQQQDSHLMFYLGIVHIVQIQLQSKWSKFCEVNALTRKPLHFDYKFNYWLGPVGQIHVVVSTAIFIISWTCLLIWTVGRLVQPLWREANYIKIRCIITYTNQI